MVKLFRIISGIYQIMADAEEIDDVWAEVANKAEVPVRIFFLSLSL